MKPDKFPGSGSKLLVFFLFALAGLLVCAPCNAALPPGVVPITSEPSHKVLFENHLVRTIEARISKGKRSLFHEHRFDGFYVFFKTDGFVTEPYNGKPVSPNLQPGAVTFIPADKPYIHRVGALGGEDAHVSVVELLTPAKEAGTEIEVRFPPFALSLENPRGRIYRLKLGPGESTDVFTRPAGTAIFAITPGQLTEKPAGKSARTWAMTPGGFRWTDASEELTIRNAGQTPVELVEIEVF